MKFVVLKSYIFICMFLIYSCMPSKADERPTLLMIIAEDEYETETLLPEFAVQFLADDFNVIDLHGSEIRSDEIVDLEDHINEANVLLISMRRRPLKESQTELIREYLKTGKPLVAIRTTSHAFATRSGEGPGVEWPGFDPEILGGNYAGHHGNRGKHEDNPAKTTFIWPVYENRNHPVLKGINPDEAIEAWSWLYKVRPLEESTEVLMEGRVGNLLPTEPVVWTNIHPGGGKVFYTSKGHHYDFREKWFQRLLRNGIYWAAGLEVPENL